jgi:phosphoenolpyruvate carboxylase
MRSPPIVDTEDKDLPLREDIRLLGRILGDTVREQSGEAVFDIVERIRQSSVRFRRDEDIAARRELAETLNSLPPGGHCRSSAHSVSSRISPTSPKISTTSAAPVPML